MSWAIPLLGSLIFLPNDGRQAEPGKVVMRQIHLFEQGAAIHGLAFSPDSESLATGVGYYVDKSKAKDLRSITTWDLKSGKVEKSLAGHPRNVVSLAFSPDGQRIASIGQSDRLILWDRKSAREILSVSEKEKLRTVTFKSDGTQLVTLSSTRGIASWDSERGTLLAEFKPPRALLGGGVLSADLRWFASASLDPGEVFKKNTATGLAYTMEIWDIEKRKDVQKFQGVFSATERSALSPDGKWLARGGAPVRLWDTKTGREVHKLGFYAAQDLTFSPDGKWLAACGSARSGSLGALAVWETATGRQVVAVNDVPATVRKLTFSGNGKRLATSQGHDVRVWELIQEK